MMELILRKVETISYEQLNGLCGAAVFTWGTLAEIVEEYAPHLIVEQVRGGKVSPINPHILAMEIEDAVTDLTCDSMPGITRILLVARLWVAENRHVQLGWQLRVGMTSYRISERKSYRT